MTNFPLSTVAAEVIPPALETRSGHVTATSLLIAEHFGKRHADVLRAIKNLDCGPEFHQRNFALMVTETKIGSGAIRKDPVYQITRDGFAFLAMGFTGKEAARWKVAYINAFNAMEAKLRSLYVAPLLSEKEFRNGIKLRSKLVLMEQSRSTLRELVAETTPTLRRNLYWQLRLINDALGIPTESAEQLLGADAPTVPA